MHGLYNFNNMLKVYFPYIIVPIIQGITLNKELLV